jgi:hypothetical protein
MVRFDRMNHKEIFMPNLTPEQIVHRWQMLYGIEPIPGIYQHLHTVTGRMLAAGMDESGTRGYIDGVLDVCRALRNVLNTNWSEEICKALAARGVPTC